MTFSMFGVSVLCSVWCSGVVFFFFLFVCLVCQNNETAECGARSAAPL